MIGIAEIIVITAVLVFIPLFIFWIWAVLDCASNESPQDNDKIVWILIILLLNWLGAVLYTLVRRPQRITDQT